MSKDFAPINNSDPVISSREDRKQTGRIVAVVGALFLILIALYHAWIRKTAVLAGVIVPALIMVLYTAWVLYSTKRDKYRQTLQAQEAANAYLSELIIDDLHRPRRSSVVSSSQVQAQVHRNTCGSMTRKNRTSLNGGRVHRHRSRNSSATKRTRHKRLTAAEFGNLNSHVIVRRCSS